MRTVVVGPNPEVEAIIARRHALGVDRYDEVWEGEYHMAPGPSGPHGKIDQALARFLGPYSDAARLIGTSSFNLGDEGNYRVPDGGYHRGEPTGVWIPTVAIVVEIASPGDETYDKLAFYAARAEELIVADLAAEAVRCFVSDGQRMVDAQGSALLGVSAEQMARALPW